MGVYSTSQFLGVAIGGSLGGWVVEMFDGQAVFPPARFWRQFGCWWQAQ